MPLLARLGYRVWAPDLRGYGESERPAGMESYAIETLLDDVAGLIDASGARSTLLMAHDWGAIIAWYFAMRRLRPLERLVIMNVPHPGASAKVFRTWKQLRRSWYALFFQIPRLPEFLLTRGDGRPLARVFRTRHAAPRELSGRGDRELSPLAGSRRAPPARWSTTTARWCAAVARRASASSASR